MSETTLSTTRLSGEELVRLGREIYERDLKATLEPEHEGEWVVIHVANGDYAVDADKGSAFDAMLEKYPRDIFYVERVGWGVAETFSCPGG